MQGFTYQELKSITVEPDTLILEYSEPDQGGTILLHRFCISQDNNVTIQTGYIHETTRQENHVLISDVPQRVLKDAIQWINHQISCVGSQHLCQLLRSFQETILGAIS